LSSNRFITPETYENLKKGIQGLITKEEQQKAELQYSKARIQAGDKAAEALRDNRNSLERLLLKEAVKLDQADKNVSKLLAELKVLQRKAGKAVNEYEKAKNSAEYGQLPASDGEIAAGEAEREDPSSLLARIDVLLHDYYERLRLEKKRFLRAVIAVIILPVAGFIAGMQYTAAVSAEKPRQPVVEQGEKEPEHTLEVPEQQADTILPEPETQPQVQEYIVQPGDILSQIAKDHYGDSSKWELIYEANRDVIEDPHRLEVGQSLVLPQL